MDSAPLAAELANRLDPAFRWEDIVVGETIRSDFHVISEEEIMAFAGRYDPLPIHIDRTAAAAGPFGMITGSGTHMIAIRQRLMYNFPLTGGVLASLGFDKIRFVAPLRAGARCQLEAIITDKRVSGSRPDRGIVHLANTLFADDTPIMTMEDTFLMKMRIPATS